MKESNADRFTWSYEDLQAMKIKKPKTNSSGPKSLIHVLAKANEAPIPSINTLGSSIKGSKAIYKGKPYPKGLKGVQSHIGGQ